MEDTILMESSQQTIDQVREATALLELIPRLLEENDRLRAAAESATREAEQLRAELQRSRADRDELGEAFGRLMGEVGGVLGEFAQRVQLPPRPSPFAREAHGHADHAAPGHSAACATNGASSAGANGATWPH